MKTHEVSLGIVRTALWAEGRGAWMSQEGNRLILAISLGPKRTCAGWPGSSGEKDEELSLRVSLAWVSLGKGEGIVLEMNGQSSGWHLGAGFGE